jgi:mutator protein MutT
MKKQIDVTAAIIVKDNKVFAARRKAGAHLAGFWEFPGGKLEAGETTEQCLARELQEEFQITTRVGAFVGESVYDYGTKIVRLMAYQVEHLSGDFELIDHDELRWLALDDLNSVEWAPADIPLVEQYHAMAVTAAYYQDNAQAYCQETMAFDVGELYKRFLAELSQGAHILDLGCGSGRDSKAFLDQGYTVTSVDGSAEVAACAERAIGHAVGVTTLQELSYSNAFDGVWASASLLHCPKAQILDVLSRIGLALKPDGTTYLSFKWGEDETVDERGRYFNNYTLATLQALIDEIADFTVIELWTETKPLRDGEQQWVNALIKKSNKIR